MDFEWLARPELSGLESIAALIGILITIIGLRQTWNSNAPSPSDAQATNHPTWIDIIRITALAAIAIVGVLIGGIAVTNSLTGVFDSLENYLFIGLMFALLAFSGALFGFLELAHSKRGFGAGTFGSFFGSFCIILLAAWIRNYPFGILEWLILPSLMGVVGAAVFHAARFLISRG
jgi:hypothetical protein